MKSSWFIELKSLLHLRQVAGVRMGWTVPFFGPSIYTKTKHWNYINKMIFFRKQHQFEFIVIFFETSFHFCIIIFFRFFYLTHLQINLNIL